MAQGLLTNIDWSVFEIGDDDEEQLRKLNVEQYFTRKELETICEYELMRYRKVVQNHTVLHQLGLTLTKPWFVERYEKRIRNRKNPEPAEPVIDYDAPHDQDWTPQAERKKENSHGGRPPPMTKPRATRTKAHKRKTKKTEVPLLEVTNY